MIRLNSRWQGKPGSPYKDDRMWVLPKIWYPPCHDWKYFPEMHWAPMAVVRSSLTKYLCMLEGYDRKLMWLMEPEIVAWFKPHRTKIDPTPLPSWICEGAEIRWRVNDEHSIRGSIPLLDKRIGWGFVVCPKNLKDYSTKEYTESVSYRTSGFFWCEQRYTMFFCRSKDLVDGVLPLGMPSLGSIWDRIRCRGAWLA